MKQESQLNSPIKPALEESKRLLQADKYAYTDEEVLQIIDFIHRMVAIDIRIYEDLLKKDTPVIHLKQYDDDHPTKSIPISQSQHRRTG